MIKRAIGAGVGTMIVPGIDKDTILPALELNKRFPQNCFPMIGLHPCVVKADYPDELKIIEDYLLDREHTFYAVGEVGLDFFHDVTFASEQKKAFRMQIDLALKFKKPLILHVRKAFAETMEIILDYKDRGLKGVFVMRKG